LIHSSAHDSYFSTVDISKPPIFDDPSPHELETPPFIEALETKLMVMSGSCSLEASPTSNQKSIESPQAPHDSIVYTKNQSISQILHRPSKSHDTIDHALEKS